MSANTVWAGVLDSCPGLLCCVINVKGKLLYATHGYKAVASRLFGHKCEEGRNYPPLITENDRAIHEALTAACLGETNAIEFSEGGTLWELTASPLRLEGQGIAGIVIRIVSGRPSVVLSDPEILNAVPYRAAIADKKGVILAVNSRLASCVRAELVGRNIIELVTPETEEALTHILMTRSGNVECTMPDITEAENFTDMDITPYLDEDMNELSPDTDIDLSRHIRLYATPSEWNGDDSVMLTFEDITEIKRTGEQLRRLLTLDRATGVLNRRGMEHVIARRLHSVIEEGGHLSLIILRIENFRIIQETQGLMRAGRIIRNFVRMLKKFSKEREGVAISRWSEDEFAILAECSGASAVVMSNEIRTKSSDVVISAGAADYADGGYMSATEFAGASYEAMTEAVNSGGNSTVLWRGR